MKMRHPHESNRPNGPVCVHPRNNETTAIPDWPTIWHVIQGRKPFKKRAWSAMPLSPCLASARLCFLKMLFSFIYFWVWGWGEAALVVFTLVSCFRPAARSYFSFPVHFACFPAFFVFSPCALLFVPSGLLFSLPKSANRFGDTVSGATCGELAGTYGGHPPLRNLVFAHGLAGFAKPQPLMESNASPHNQTFIFPFLAPKLPATYTAIP